MSRKKAKISNNTEVLEILESRPSALKEVSRCEVCDDVQVKRMRVFMERFERLEQWQKDLFYVYIMCGMRGTARLYCISPSTVQKKIKEIREILQ